MNDVIYYVVRLWKRGMSAVPCSKWKKKTTLVTCTRLFCESCELGGGNFFFFFLIASHLKRRDRRTKGAVCVALLAPGHGRKAECCAPQTWPSCAIVSAGAPAGRWSAQSLTRPTRLQLLPTCGASQIREGVPLMGPLVCVGVAIDVHVCACENVGKGGESARALCLQYSGLL